MYTAKYYLPNWKCWAVVRGLSYQAAWNIVYARRALGYRAVVVPE